MIGLSGKSLIGVLVGIALIGVVAMVIVAMSDGDADTGRQRADDWAAKVQECNSLGMDWKTVDGETVCVE